MTDDKLLSITNPLMAGYNRAIESYDDAMDLVPFGPNSYGAPGSSPPLSSDDSSALKSTMSTIGDWLKKIGSMINLSPSIKQDAEKLRVGFTVSVGLPKISDSSLAMLQALSDKVESSNQRGLPKSVMDEARDLARKQVNAKYYQKTKDKRALDYQNSKGQKALGKLTKDLDKIKKQHEQYQLPYPQFGPPSPSSPYPQLPPSQYHQYPMLGPGK